MNVFRRAGLVWAGTLLAAALAFVTQILLARHFETRIYGELSNAYVIAVLVATFGFQGVADVVLRYRGRVSLKRVTLACAWLVVAALIATTTWILFEGNQEQGAGILLAFIPFVVVQGLLFAGMTTFQLRGEYKAIATWPVIQHAGRILVVIGVVLLGTSALSVPLAWSVVLLPVGIYGVVKMREAIASADTHGPTTIAAPLVAPALPFSISRMLEFAEIQLPIVLAMALLGPQEAGLAAAALVFIQGLLLLPIAVFQRLLRARMHEWSQQDPRRLMRVTIRGALLMVLLGSAFSFVIWPFVDVLLEFIFGKPYTGAADFFRILLIALPIWFAAITMNTALVSARLAVDRLLLQLLAVGVIVVISITGTAEEGLAWLAWAMLIGQSILLLGAGILLILRTRLQPA